ncbi:hypothetical protein DBR06_SOUSAS18610019, partial [Sousa chinensis]
MTRIQETWLGGSAGQRVAIRPEARAGALPQASRQQAQGLKEDSKVAERKNQGETAAKAQGPAALPSRKLSFQSLTLGF